MLATLLGRSIGDLTGTSSAEIERMLRQELLKRLSSEGASELIALGRFEELLGPEVSSLFSALGASWSQAAPGWSGVTASWGEAAGRPGAGWSGESGAWSGESGAWSGVGASWSAQPFSQQRERGFFLHVNAEVIFYGGTHPDATVWIDGKQVKLAPDGTFRYHFKFPDGDYSIPIVARSPDGVEERSATLSFQRKTAKSGGVGSTKQPKRLSKPVGRKR